MPYRYAHVLLALVLVPLVVVSFWRDYFGVLPGASFAFHLHGLTAAAWLLLVTAQSWSIHARRNALHRRLGRATFVVVPLFVAGSVFVFQSMAVKHVTGHPFYRIFGPQLGLHDLLSTIALVAMVAMALRRRRRIGLHAGWMLATVLLVFPPVMARVPLPYPRDIHLGELFPMALALFLAARNKRDAQPMLAVAGVLGLQIVLFHTLGASMPWREVFVATVGMPIPGMISTALALAGAALLMLLANWRAMTRRTGVVARA